MESVTASAGVSAQLQIAGTKTALNVQKQEGENANNLIQSAVEGTEDTDASTDAAQATENNVDTLI